MAIDDGLQVGLTDALEVADEEAVDGDQRAGMWGLDTALAELGAEPLQKAYLFVRQFDLPLRDALLQARQALVFVVTGPYSAHAAGGDLDAPEHEFAGDAHSAPWPGWAKQRSKITASVSAGSRLGCDPFGPGSRSISPSTPKVW